MVRIDIMAKVKNSKLPAGEKVEMVRCHFSVPIPVGCTKFVATIHLPHGTVNKTRWQKEKSQAAEKRMQEWCHLTHITDTLEEYFEKECFEITTKIKKHKYFQKWVRASIYYQVAQLLKDEEKPLPNLAELALMSLGKVNDTVAFKKYVEEKKQWDATHTIPSMP